MNCKKAVKKQIFKMLRIWKVGLFTNFTQNSDLGGIWKTVCNFILALFFFFSAAEHHCQTEAFFPNKFLSRPWCHLQWLRLYCKYQWNMKCAVLRMYAYEYSHGCSEYMSYIQRKSVMNIPQLIIVSRTLCSERNIFIVKAKYKTMVIIFYADTALCFKYFRYFAKVSDLLCKRCKNISQEKNKYWRMAMHLQIEFLE